MIVLDASVIIKWFRTKDETHVGIARRLRRRHLMGKELIAVPELVFYEVLNAIQTKWNTTFEDLVEIADVLYEMRLQRFSSSPELQREAISLSSRYKITIYDASYVALAKFLGVNLLTADQKLYRKVKSLRFVKLLDRSTD